MSAAAKPEPKDSEVERLLSQTLSGLRASRRRLASLDRRIEEIRKASVPPPPPPPEKEQEHG